MQVITNDIDPAFGTDMVAMRLVPMLHAGRRLALIGW